MSKYNYILLPSLMLIFSFLNIYCVDESGESIENVNSTNITTSVLNINVTSLNNSQSDETPIIEVDLKPIGKTYEI